MTQRKGRVTIPTDLDVVPQTLEMLDKWGADAIRDCDGTEFPERLKNTGAKIYATYYTTRKDNKWAKENPDEIQQMYIMTSFHTAVSDTLEIHLMDHLYPDMLAVNTRDDIQRWWEVIDRTTGETVDTKYWSYDEKSGNVVIHPSIAFHEYTVIFWLISCGILYICIMQLSMNGKMLNRRLLLMYGSPRQKHTLCCGSENF